MTHVFLYLECIRSSMSLILLMQDHLMELQQYWQNYEHELESCQKYITNIVTPFLQSAVTDKEISTLQKMAQVTVTSLYSRMWMGMKEFVVGFSCFGF